MTLRLVSRPLTHPISLSEAKAHLREDGFAQDAAIVLYIAAATANAEAFMGRALIDQTWDYYAPAFPSSSTRGIPLPLPPLIEVIGVFGTDTGGVETEFSDYVVDYTGLMAEVRLAPAAAWPSSSSVRIRFRAGYLDTTSSPAIEAVPEDIKAGILLMLGQMYANREATVVGVIAVELPMGVQWLWRPHRVRLGLA